MAPGGPGGPASAPGAAQAGPVDPLLEEFKSNKGRRFELSDLTGHFFEFCLDQHGSRFIQQVCNCCRE